MRSPTGRRRFIQIGLALTSLGLIASCGQLPLSWQQPRVPRIGYLALDSTAAEYEAFRSGLRELGYVDGRNIVIEARWAGSNDQLPALAAELVSLPVALIVTAPAIQAAMDATSTIPIVFTNSADPVQSGYVASLPRPGGNVTGLSGLGPQMTGKRLQLLGEIVPGVVAVDPDGTQPHSR